jgi:hypothetical protein
MNGIIGQEDNAVRGILIRAPRAHGALDALQQGQAALARLDLLDLAPRVHAQAGADPGGEYLSMRLTDETAMAWTPGFNTLTLGEALQLDTVNRHADLVREIVVAMLAAPVVLEFPSLDELVSAVRIRCNIVRAARKTTLDFDTEATERPEGYWAYNEDRGFTILPGVSLIEALTQATQPAVSGKLYSFACYRATEYMMLLGIAQELEQSNPEMYQRLQTLWSRRAIMSGEFHEVFLREQGSINRPVPPRYYVPGDRVWFRNPDAASAEVTGFEGSWVMYHGCGLFTNFWKSEQTYTFTRKCVEIYHWRHGLYHNDQGEASMNEARVEPLVEATLRDPDELARIMSLMERFREPQGVYTAAGGCIDATREFARWVRPGTTDMPLPAA